MHTIYRYENDRGEGPYSQVSLREHQYSKQHPGGRVDGCQAHPDDCYYACPTLGLLHLWFFGYHKRLRKAGFNIVEIQVVDFVLGKSGRQCSFRPFDVISTKVIRKGHPQLGPIATQAIWRGI